jgi:hypothetical protein
MPCCISRSRHTARRGYAGRNDSFCCFNFLTQRGQANSVTAPPEDNCLKITDFIGLPRVATFQRKRITAY